MRQITRALAVGIRPGRLLAVVLPLLPSAVGATEPSGEDRALSIRSNVVVVNAVPQPGTPNRVGLGFIVGRRGKEFVILTANHVVRGDDPDAEDKSPRITYYEDQGAPVRGVLETKFLPRGRGDFAVIVAPGPQTLSLVTEAQAGSPPTRGQEVWPVGRAGSWAVPVIPGRISRVDALDRHIEVEGLIVAPSSSGGPIVSKEGIVGMVVEDSAFGVIATSIDVIERVVRDEWRYPWILSKVISKISDVLPKRFLHASGSFERDGELWVEKPPHQYGHFTFEYQGVVDGYMYLVDKSRVQSGDRNRPFTMRIPLKGGMLQWSFPNPFVWKDLYVVRPTDK